MAVVEQPVLLEKEIQSQEHILVVYIEEDSLMIGS